MPLIVLSCMQYTLSKGKILFPFGNCEVKHGEPHELDHDFSHFPQALSCVPLFTVLIISPGMPESQYWYNSDV